ncbi:hypothetical protein [Lacipirellula sp.]|uniref:hypothetical protein n=1 Tax=Lacipirellula sp. TaxID=2691419 RepID=UPI003D09AF45
MTIRGIVILVVGLLLSDSAVGELLQLTSGQALRLDFELHGPFDQEPDVLFLGFDNSVIANSVGTVSFSLYIESKLLGVTVNSLVGQINGPVGLHPAGLWKSSMSSFTSGTPTIVDFGSAFSGYRTGRIELAIESGDLLFNPEGLQVVLVIANDFAGGTVVEPLPRITSVAIVPEPAGALLAMLALIGLASLRHRAVA